MAGAFIPLGSVSGSAIFIGTASATRPPPPPSPIPPDSISDSEAYLMADKWPIQDVALGPYSNQSGWGPYGVAHDPGSSWGPTRLGWVTGIEWSGGGFSSNDIIVRLYADNSAQTLIAASKTEAPSSLSATVHQATLLDPFEVTDGQQMLYAYVGGVTMRVDNRQGFDEKWNSSTLPPTNAQPDRFTAFTFVYGDAGSVSGSGGADEPVAQPAGDWITRDDAEALVAAAVADAEMRFQTALSQSAARLDTAIADAEARLQAAIDAAGGQHQATTTVTEHTHEPSVVESLFHPHIDDDQMLYSIWKGARLGDSGQAMLGVYSSNSDANLSVFSGGGMPAALFLGTMDNPSLDSPASKQIVEWLKLPANPAPGSEAEEYIRLYGSKGLAASDTIIRHSSNPDGFLILKPSGELRNPMIDDLVRRIQDLENAA